MLRLTVEVDTPEFMTGAVKETLKSYIDKFGDTRVVKVEVIKPEQIEIQHQFGTAYKRCP